MKEIEFEISTKLFISTPDDQAVDIMNTVLSHMEVYLAAFQIEGAKVELGKSRDVYITSTCHECESEHNYHDLKQVNGVPLCKECTMELYLK